MLRQLLVDILYLGSVDPYIFADLDPGTQNITDPDPKSWLVVTNDISSMISFRVLPVTYHKYLAMFLINQGYNARKVNCGRVYSAYTLKPVLLGRNL